MREKAFDDKGKPRANNKWDELLPQITDGLNN